MSEEKEASSAVRKFIDEDELAGDVEINEADLDSGMIKQASLATHYGVQASKANRQVSLMKTRLEVVEAQTYRRLREEAADRGEKVTEAQLKMLVQSEPAVVRAQRDVIDAQYTADVGKTAFEAFRQRRDMLIQLGVQAREERKGELSIGGGVASDAVSTEGAKRHLKTG